MMPVCVPNRESSSSSLDTLSLDDILVEPRGSLGHAMIPAGCGELVQGTLDGEPVLVTCPIDWYSQVSVRLLPGSRWSLPANLTKTATALRAGCQFLGLGETGLQAHVASTIPWGRGYASSTADIGAALYALGQACGHPLCAEDVAHLAVAIEPTDSSLFPGLTLYAYKTGVYQRLIGPPPALSVVVFDPGVEVDTLAYNHVDRSAPLHGLARPHREAFELLVHSVEQGDIDGIGAAATLSARLHQRLLYNPLLQDVLSLAAQVNGVGVCRAHSGSVLGILLDTARTDLSRVVQYCRERMEQPCDVSLHRMVGGGPIYR